MRQPICKIAFAAIVLAVGWAIPGQASAQDQSSSSQAQQPSQQAQQPSQLGQQPSLTRSRTIETQATVDKIDKAHRTLTVRTPDGNETTITAGDQVKNFDQIKVGDKVDVVYYESIAVALAKPGEKPGLTESEQATHAAPGARPEGAMMRQVQVTAQVVSVDPQKNEVVLRGPEGTRRIQVQDTELAAKLHELKPGDTVTATYTEAIAASVNPMR